MPQTARLASCVLLIAWVLCIPHEAVAAQHDEDVPFALGDRTGQDHATEQRVETTLKNVGKTLILERTRGPKEMDVYQKAAPAVVLVVTREGLGSGAIIDGQGHVITNWHVVGSHPQVVVVLKPKDSTELKKELAFGAMVEKVDEVTDLALLRIQTLPKTAARLALGDVATLVVGQDVHAIGHPAGEAWTYTKGIISQIRANYPWSVGDGREHRAKVIQTQTPVNPGNSGGPLLDDAAKLIGINAFRRQGEGLNYAVAVDEIQTFLQRGASRESPSQQPPGAAGGQVKCPDIYDTKRQGWTDIVGCYSLTFVPPPDLWLVYRGPNRPVAYIGVNSPVLGQIDTVVRGKDQQWETLEYYVDLDCNGTVDLIEYRRKGSQAIDSYRVPEKPLRLVSLTKELDRAIKGRKIPYPTLRVCQ